MPHAAGNAANEALLTQAGEILATAVGLRLDGSMTRRLGRTLEEAAAARGEEVGAFVSALRLEPAALQALLDRITVQETSFFRDPAQFRCLADSVLPSLPGPLTLWSAGCATGQEAYSLAMTLAESGREDWRVLASDVSTKALDRTRAALYSERELRGLSDLRRDRFMVRAGSKWEMSAGLRDRVSILRHNLVNDPPPFDPGSCAVVFCRNVLIYFEPKDTADFLNRLHGWMDRGSYLFLGFSESLWNITERFLPVRIQEAFVYRPAEALAPVRSSVSPRPPGRVASDAATLRRESSKPGSDARLAGASRRRLRNPVPFATSDVQGILTAARRAVASGDIDGAIASFRQAAYLDPDDPITHLHLGLALESGRHQTAALRAFAAARGALERTEPATWGDSLEGFDAAELAGLLDEKLRGIR